MSWVTGLIGLIVGAFLALLAARRAIARAHLETETWRSRHEAALLERARCESEAARVPALESRIEVLGTEVTRLQSLQVEAQTRLTEQARAHQEKIAALTDLRSGIDERLKTVANEALRSNQGAFLELANQAFEKHKVGADAELAARHSAVAELITPLADALKSLRDETQQLERNRAQAYGALSGEL